MGGSKDGGTEGTEGIPSGGTRGIRSPGQTVDLVDLDDQPTAAEQWRGGMRKLQNLKRWQNRKVAQKIDQKSRCAGVVLLVVRKNRFAADSKSKTASR